MARQASLHAKRLLPVSASWLLVQKNLGRLFSNPPPAALNPNSDNMQQARGQRTQRSIDVGNSDHETGSQKKLQNRNTASRNVIITAQQAGLQEQELKPHAAPSVQQKAQNAFAQNVLKPGVTTFDTHIIDGQQRVIEKEIDVETNGETDVEDFCSGDTLQKKRVEQSNDPLKIINK